MPRPDKKTPAKSHEEEDYFTDSSEPITGDTSSTSSADSGPVVTGKSNVIHVETEIEYNSIFKANPDRLIIVDFSATWCGPCRSIEPKYNELSVKHSKSVFLHVDIDELDDAPAVQDISTVPTFKLFKKGNKLAQFSGANIAKLEDLISKHE